MERRPHRILVVEEAEQAGRKPTVDAEEEQVLDHGARIDPPVRHGPGCGVVAEPGPGLVRLGVPGDVVARPGGDDDQYRGVEQARPSKTGPAVRRQRDIPVPGHELGPVEDHEGCGLGVAGRRSAAGEVEQLIDPLGGEGIGGEGPCHAAGPDEAVEFAQAGGLGHGRSPLAIEVTSARVQPSSWQRISAPTMCQIDSRTH